ncbi:MAG: hypothetical protein HW413_1846 [Thermoleophilia bacterium]|nr:hypothetical protein [Thermoleophilia bacterium]
MRIAPRLTAASVTVAFVGLLAGASPGTALPPPVLARSIYVVQPDPRLCPSPLCGGYWVSRANHARTRCHDGLLRPRCYVAIAVSTLTRKPLVTGLPANALVRAAIGPWTFEGFGELGAVAVAEIWRPVTQDQPTGGFFRLRDIGIRCIRAPCFSFRAWRLNRSYRVTVSDVDLGPARLAPKTLKQAEAALIAPEGLLASGGITRTTDGGRSFTASQVFLRIAQPRA